MNEGMPAMMHGIMGRGGIMGPGGMMGPAARKTTRPQNRFLGTAALIGAVRVEDRTERHKGSRRAVVDVHATSLGFEDAGPSS